MPQPATHSTAKSHKIPSDVLGALAGVVMTSVLGSIITMRSIESGWLASLVQPSFMPPNAVFGIVWTALYATMFISYLFVRSSTKPRRSELQGVFYTNLMVNLCWSIVFFGMQNIVGGLIVILAYLAVCIGTSIFFAQASKRAGWLLFPLIAWVTFASVLNYAFFKLN